MQLAPTTIGPGVSQAGSHWHNIAGGYKQTWSVVNGVYSTATHASTHPLWYNSPGQTGHSLHYWSPRKRKTWMHPLTAECLSFGEYHTIMHRLRQDGGIKFFDYFRMLQEIFDELLDIQVKKYFIYQIKFP